jgi:gliding motility-associated-like protein
MIRGSVCNIKKVFISILILSGLTVSLYSQDKQISGIINIYKHVETIGPGTDNVTLTDVNNIEAGDTILLIQMKGAIIYVDESGSYGTYRESLGAPGSSEFLIVQSVNSSTNNVIFTNDILNSYDVKGVVQLVKVPFYNSATVTADLTCQPWDSISKTGGVLTMIVGRTLSLNSNIDVSGKGFAGGAATLGDAICTITDISLYDKYSYPSSFTNSGLKGESQVIKVWLNTTNIPSFSPDYVKGKGANFTGGGGGNGKFSGGGGGSNYGIGGKGGVESSTCGDGKQGGNGLQNRTVKVTDLNGGIFFGGGGGSSTFQSGSTSSPGGRGGGIIIIMCDTLKGNGKFIKAEGELLSVPASGNAGSGGGGGGGSIALYQQSFSSLLPTSSSALTISANGGKGGNTGNFFGEGGGGGGGLILTNNITFPTNVLRTVTGGAVGTQSGTTGSGTSGNEGDKLTTFAPILNGFLFNSVRSAVTGDLVDSICSNVPFGIISGTQPVGGVTPYTFQWESSTTSETSGFALASGMNSGQDYSPGLLTQTTWFRRVVKDNNTPQLVDISKAVKIVVQQAITGNLVGKDTIICYNQDPLSLVPLNSGPANGSANNYYEYKWIENLTNTNWNASLVAVGTAANSSYDPPALTATTYYQRVVTSGRCVDHSSTIKITVLPLITGNITSRPDSVICEGSKFNTIDASTPGGGDLINYWYQWQDSLTSGSWVPAPNTNVSTTYNADTSKFSSVETRYFRRVVFSGPDSVCRNNSTPINLTRYHKIKNNLILSDPSFCSVNPPLSLAGSIPTHGNAGNYNYEWQDSSAVSTWTTRGMTGLSFSPPDLVDSTWYRRIVKSSKCADTSHLIVAYRMPIADAGPDTTICGPKVLLYATPSVGTGLWTSSAVVISAANDPSSSVTIDTTFTGRSISHNFVWEEVNGPCKSKDSVTITFDKEVFANAGRDTSLFSFDNTIHMVALKPAFATGSWFLVSGSGNPMPDTSATAKVEGLSKGLNTFKWRVQNDKCISESLINVTVYDLIIPEGFSPNSDIWNNTFTITGLDVPINQDAELKIINGAGTEIFSTSTLNGGVWKNWDGKNSNGIDLPEGTYYYLLKIISKNVSGQVFKKSGFIVLKRY